MSIWNLRRSNETAQGHAPLPQAGDFVQLQVSSDQQGALYGAQVRVVGSRRLFLDTAGPLALPPRSSLILTYVSQDALYRFESRVIGPSRPGRVVVARPRSIVRIQRRQYYRLPMESPTTFRLINDDGRRDSSGPAPARLVNVSGGGALLSSARPVPAGVTVAVRVPAGLNGHPVDAEGEILDCHVASQGAARTYLIRVRFFDPPRLTTADREAIIAHIFHQQRLMLRGRKLLRA